MQTTNAHSFLLNLPSVDCSRARFARVDGAGYLKKVEAGHQRFALCPAWSLAQAFHDAGNLVPALDWGATEFSFPFQ